MKIAEKPRSHDKKHRIMVVANFHRNDTLRNAEHNVGLNVNQRTKNERTEKNVSENKARHLQFRLSLTLSSKFRSIPSGIVSEFERKLLEFFTKITANKVAASRK